MGSTERRCVFMCVSDGSVTGQEWAFAAGFLLMKPVSIYLLLNISLQRWILFLLYVEGSDSSVCCKEMACTANTNRVNSFFKAASSCTGRL